MNIKIEIKTPKGLATKTEKRIRTFIIPLGGKLKTYTSPTDDCIYWEYTGTIKQCLKINRNASMYDKLIRNVFENKQMKKYLPRIVGTEGETEIKNLLINQTQVNIIKEATAQELIEHQKTFWQKIKQTFKESKI